MSHMFYRVEDSSSRARARYGQDLYPEDRRADLSFDPREVEYYGRLGRHLPKHLRWSNRTPTGLISVYSDLDVAHREARRRVRAGKEEVCIVMIDASEGRWEEQPQKARQLASELGVWIPEWAWNNPRYEYVSIKCIPAKFIVGIFEVFAQAAEAWTGTRSRQPVKARVRFAKHGRHVLRRWGSATY